MQIIYIIVGPNLAPYKVFKDKSDAVVCRDRLNKNRSTMYRYTIWELPILPSGWASLEQEDAGT